MYINTGASSGSEKLWTKKKKKETEISGKLIKAVYASYVYVYKQKDCTSILQTRALRSIFVIHFLYAITTGEQRLYLSYVHPSICLSVFLYVSSRLPMDVFSWNLIPVGNFHLTLSSNSKFGYSRIQMWCNLRDDSTFCCWGWLKSTIQGLSSSEMLWGF